MVLLSLMTITFYLLSFYDKNGEFIMYTHDNFDSYITVFKILSDTGTFFSSNNTLLPNVMNGLPRVALPSEYNVVSILYYFFSVEKAYLINEFFIRIIAFFGMLLLLKQHFLNDKMYRNVYYLLIQVGVSLIFALLPYLSVAGASIAGQPIVLYAFLNLKNNDLSVKNWIILALFPFYSLLILAGIFVLVMLTVVALYDWIKNKRINFYLFYAILMMSILYLFAEYRLVINLLDPIYISHRVEFVCSYNNYIDSMEKSANLFFNGQYHAHSIHGQFLLPFVFVGTLLLLLNNKLAKYISLLIGISLIVAIVYFKDYSGTQWINYVKLHIYNSTYRNYYVLVTIILLSILFFKKHFFSFYILSSILLISLFSGFEDYTGIQNFKENFSILTQIQFDRFYFLFAFLWFLLFALVAKSLLEKTKVSLLLIAIVMFMQLTFSFKIHNGESWRGPVSVNKFYAKSLFDEVKKYINKPVNTYRVMNIGIRPSKAIYNGFYVLDAYWSTYPLEYKHEFRKIIAPQLAKSERWTHYFDTWGSRCRLMDRNKNISLNLEQFKDMGGKYIFSSYDVNINDGVGVKFLKKFSHREYKSTIYLFEVL